MGSEVAAHLTLWLTSAIVHAHVDTGPICSSPLTPWNRVSGSSSDVMIMVIARNSPRDIMAFKTFVRDSPHDVSKRFVSPAAHQMSWLLPATAHVTSSLLRTLSATVYMTCHNVSCLQQPT